MLDHTKAFTPCGLIRIVFEEIIVTHVLLLFLLHAHKHPTPSIVQRSRVCAVSCVHDMYE